ncbi:MAG: hypothetical protein ACK4MM_02045 [Fervidobacterium sp.]
MRFLDGVDVTYVKKSEANKLSKVLREISKLSELEFKPVNSVNYGHYRFEFYEPADKLPTIKLTGFLTCENPIEWLMSHDNQSEIDLKDIFHVVDTEILEIDPEGVIHTVVVEQYRVYAIVNKEKSQNLTLNDLVIHAIDKLFEIHFEDEFNKNDYDIEIHQELTDYFI